MHRHRHDSQDYTAGVRTLIPTYPGLLFLTLLELNNVPAENNDLGHNTSHTYY